MPNELERKLAKLDEVLKIAQISDDQILGSSIGRLKLISQRLKAMAPADIADRLLALEAEANGRELGIRIRFNPRDGSNYPEYEPLTDADLAARSERETDLELMEVAV